MKSSECEYISTCPYYSGDDDGQVMPEHFKEQYCRGIFIWCGRYLVRLASDGVKKQAAPIERG